MTNLCLIIDSEPSFLRSKVETVYKEWGFPRQNVKEQTFWDGPQRGFSLFGGKMMIHLNLEDKNDMKSFVNIITDRKTKVLFDDKNWFGNGVIITCSTAQGAKKIQDLVTKSGGTFLKKEDTKTRKAELLNGLNLVPESRKLVDYFVGEDYTLLLSFVNEMKKKTKEEQAKVTPDKVLTYFPPTPGSILPWEFMNPLMDGNTAKALSEFERTIKNTHVLVPMLFLQRQMSLLLRISIARLDIPNNPKALATAIGEKPYGGFWPVYNVARRTKVVNVERAAIRVVKLENSIKGNSHVDPNQEFRATIAELGMLLNH